jgi:transaldolase
MENLEIKIFADGANLDEIRKVYSEKKVSGFTTNPTLMKKSGVTDYTHFARKVLEVVKDLPVSFEVFADDLPEMERQALEIASWGSNVNVKIPVMNTKRISTGPVIKSLSDQGVSLNVTALMTVDQVKSVRENLSKNTPAIVSVFAGRIADTGRDPVPIMANCLDVLSDFPLAELLWASQREVFNIYEASRIGCDIITVTPDMFKKLSLAQKNLDDFSQETVQMFYDDAQAAGYKI